MTARIKSFINKAKVLRSLKARIFVLLFLAGMIPAFIMRIGMIGNYEEHAVSVRSSDVTNQAQILANHLIAYNYLQAPTSEVINAELEQLSNLYDGRVLIVDKAYKIIKDTYGISEGKTLISEEVIQCFRGDLVSRYDKEENYIEVAVPIADDAFYEEEVPEAPDNNGESVNIHGVLLISVSTENISLTGSVLSRKADILEIMMGIVIVGIVVWLANILIRPINRVTDAINEVKGGFTDEIIEVSDYLETEHIIDAFNQVISRMRILDNSREEFVSNVSHELKTPLTSMKVLADSLLMQEDAPLELYKEFMEDITNEIERENKIINDLLSLVKMDKTAANLNIETINVNELMELILKRLTPIAKKEDIELIFESMRQVVAQVDEVKITLALTNLIENAIKYNTKHGWVKVTLNADHQFFTVEVSDSGIGIPEDLIEHIYERFFRADKSHSREIGGTGLGLAITRNAILMHRGSIKASSVEGEGTTFTAKIPLSHLS